MNSEALKDDAQIKDPVFVKGSEESIVNSLVSSNGVEYLDPRPLRYCKDYQMLIKPTMDCCKHCGFAWNVEKLVNEEWIWYLNPETGAVTEHGDENSIPVTAILKIATTTYKNEAHEVIVYDRFKGVTDCPRHVYCEP